VFKADQLPSERTMVDCTRCRHKKNHKKSEAVSERQSVVGVPGIGEDRVRELIKELVEEMREEWVEEDTQKFEELC